MSSKGWLLALVVLACGAGCSDEVGNLAGGQGLDAGTTDSGLVDTGADAGSVDVPQVTVCDGLDGGAAPSNQTVDFVLTNTSSATLYVAELGLFCAPLEILRGGAPLVLGFNSYPECEGPALPPGFITQWRAVAPAAQVRLPWDARAMNPASYCVDCAFRGAPELGVISIPTGASAPVGAGAYEVSFLVARDLTGPCEADLSDPTIWRCRDALPSTGFSRSNYGAMSTCLAPERVGLTTFSLPASGDLEVQVSLR
ncbi:MAG: hypothetical protein KC933_01905 [Myxococcales bacterium]|nr:hypothetical protein [Myxococcales bacterium]MCB9652272.1 hypothetical protein [Deltaproteobacteria bacterium]